MNNEPPSENELPIHYSVPANLLELSENFQVFSIRTTKHTADLVAVDEPKLFEVNSLEADIFKLEDEGKSIDYAAIRAMLERDLGSEARNIYARLRYFINVAFEIDQIMGLREYGEDANPSEGSIAEFKEGLVWLANPAVAQTFRLTAKANTLISRVISDLNL